MLGYSAQKFPHVYDQHFNTIFMKSCLKKYLLLENTLEKNVFKIWLDYAT